MTDYTNPNTRKTTRIVLVLLLLLVTFLAFPAQTKVSAQTLPVYIVQSGDTLSDIAIKFYTTVDDIMSVNNRTSADALSIGTRLYIPGLSGMKGVLTTEYAPLGASLMSLARRSQTLPSQLAKLNKITSPSELYIGRQVILTFEENAVPIETMPSLLPGQSLLELAIFKNINPWQVTQRNQLLDPNHALPRDTYFTDAAEAGGGNLAVPGVNSIEIDNLPFRQGNTWVVKVDALQNMSISAELIGVKPEFVDLGEGNYVAFGGINALTEPGIYPLTLEFTQENSNVYRFVQYVMVNSSSFETDQPLQVDPSTIDDVNVIEENERFAEIVKPVTTNQLWNGQWIYPAADYDCIRSFFGSRRTYNDDPRLYYHTGLDLGYCYGIDIIAPADGRVAAVLPDQIVRGNLLVIDHGLGVYSVYMHLSKFNVEVGQMVKQGDLLGEIGNTGRSSGAHLHFEIDINGTPVNPLTWLNRVFP
ncbi:MAG: peptidoglycan DD-metalloendopeptidase family protein [Anaerolineaceae bacterium]